MTFWALFGWRIAQVLGFTLAIVAPALLFVEVIRPVDNKAFRPHVAVIDVGMFVLGLSLAIAITEHLP